MRYFVIEDGLDVSAYDSLESAVRAIEPEDVLRVKLFDEWGNEHPLSVERRQVRFLGIWPTAVASTTASTSSNAAALEFETCLREYARKATNLPSDVDLPRLVDLIANYQGIPRGKSPTTP